MGKATDARLIIYHERAAKLGVDWEDVARFEEEYAAFCGTRYAVGVAAAGLVVLGAFAVTMAVQSMASSIRVDRK